MSIGMITLVIVVSLLALMATGFPIAFSLMAISVAGIIFWVNPGALTALSSRIFISVTTEYFIAIPMFIFMAAVLQVSGIGTALYDMMYKWMARLRGGLAMGSVLISTLLAALTGVAATATVSMGLLAYPEMKNRGYSKYIAIGSITSGGCLGPLIPPSVPMIIVAIFGAISIGKLFIAGILPGLLTSLIFVSYIGFRCFRNPALGPSIPLDEQPTWREKFASLRGVILPIIVIILVLGTIYTGIATPSEAGGVGAFGALVCAAVYRNLTVKNLKSAIMISFRLSAMIFWLLIAGSMFSSLLGLTGVTHYIGDIMTGMVANRWVTLFAMLFIVFIMGMFMDPTPITIICIPIFMPIVRTLGFDPLWFGLIFTMDLLIGFITPPFGLNMFYFKGLNHPGVTMTDIYRSTLPFVLLMIIAWIICIVFPPIATWLPGTMIK